MNFSSTRNMVSSDSGAEISVVPPNLVNKADYTSEVVEATGAAGQFTAPLAQVRIEVDGHTATMPAIVRTYVRT